MSENWVEERAKCTLFKMFKTLESGVKRDVEKRNKQAREPDDQLDCESEPGDQHGFMVIRHSPDAAVTFRCAANGLNVSGPNNLLFHATVTLCNDSECRWLVEGEELEPWQVRKRALEALFGFR